MAQINPTQLQGYVSNALESVEFKLIRDRHEVDEDSSTSFHLEFAHQIFGENECIFGYKELKIRLNYTAGPLNIFLGTKYNSRIEDSNTDGLKSDDIVSKISKLLTIGCYYTNIDEFLSKLDKENSFKPFGEKIHSWDIGEDKEKRTFEIYECDSKTPGFMAFHARLQTFLLWFVDAASYIDVEDTQWMFLVCYEKYTRSDGTSMYATVGYTTLYLYYAYPHHNRPRISQMLVLPPFQGMGIGATFVEVVYNKFKGDPKVIDITVEDPSDDFRRVRNFVDVKLSKELPEFSPERLHKGFNKDMVTAAKEKFKINPRQCRIAYEILRLNATNINNPAEYKEYRLCVKKRLNIAHHKQKSDVARMEKAGIDMQMTLAGLPTNDERIDQLKEEYQAHEEEYRRILNRLQQA